MKDNDPEKKITRLKSRILQKRSILKKVDSLYTDLDSLEEELKKYLSRKSHLFFELNLLKERAKIVAKYSNGDHLYNVKRKRLITDYLILIDKILEDLKNRKRVYVEAINKRKWQTLICIFLLLIFLTVLNVCTFKFFPCEYHYFNVVIGIFFIIYLAILLLKNNYSRKQKELFLKVSQERIIEEEGRDSKETIKKSGPNLTEHSSYIKSVFIELKNYYFNHSPLNHNTIDGRFIGREFVKDRLKTVLENSNTRSGTYLVTGFRGMGKTSVVRNAILELNEQILSSNYPDWIPINPLDRRRDAEKTRDCFRKAATFLFVLLGFIIVSFLIENISKTQTTFLLLTFFMVYTIFRILYALRKAITWIFTILFAELTIFTLIFYYILRSEIYSPENLNISFPLALLSIALFSIFSTYILTVFCFFVIDVFVYLHHYDYRNDPKEYENFIKSFEINLSQEELKEISILKRMTRELMNYWENFRWERVRFFDRKLYYPFQWFLGFLSFRSNQSEKVFYDEILNDLHNLNSRIVSQFTTETVSNNKENFNIGIKDFFLFAIPLNKKSNKNSNSYPIANSKEIEDELINIFKKIDTYRNTYNEEIPNFVFVVDELDKIEPHNNSNLAARESADPYFDNFTSIQGSSKIRERQAAVAKLLGNLKGFLNVVQAKFIFIGGREMFDASLADIADRDSFYSSVFNDVIYINSFFKDKARDRIGITQLTETYLCKIIMANLKAEDSLKHPTDYNLKNLFEKLEFKKNSLYINDSDENNNETKKISEHKIIQESIKAKVIILLQNYIIFLAYRSNGTPKKLATLTEDITCEGSDKLFNNSHYLVVQHEKSSNKYKDQRLFLRFDFDFQYEIGLTANLYRPFIIINSRNMLSMGDKLLFSSAFIIDHILKFHPFGFSWRNLEMIPEVILVNKEPNLRRFVEELLIFLSNTYIRSTVSGIFQYKFYSKVTRELKYISKTSDLSTAAFNFTLDESLQIKRHYKRKLVELEKKYKNFDPIQGDNQFIHSLGFIQTILGDLYFYDKEYDEALIYFTESIQTLRLPHKAAKANITPHQLYIWLRNKLKLGLILEKMRAFDSAFSYYKTLILELNPYFKSIIEQIGDESDTQSVLIKSEGHRTIQLVTIPFIGYLSVIEKARRDGITLFNLRKCEEDLENLITPEYYDKNDLDEQKNSVQVDPLRQDVLWADYYNNVGSLLFYKNCLFPDIYEYDSHPNSNYWHKISKTFCNEVKKIYNIKETIYESKKSYEDIDFHPSITSIIYYYQSIAMQIRFYRPRLILGLEYLEEKLDICENDVLSLIPAFLLPGCSTFLNAHRFYYLGNLVSKFGDAILGSINTIQLSNNEEIDFFYLHSHGDEKKGETKDFIKCIKNLQRIERNSVGIFTINTVLELYILAAALYLRASRIYSFAFQYKKILYSIKDILSNYLKDLNTEDDREKYIKEVKNTLTTAFSENPDKLFEGIACLIFKSVTWNYNVSNRPQILKYKEIFDASFFDSNRPLIYNNINHSSDIREVLILVEGIKLKLTHLRLCSQNISPYNLCISPYSMINSRFVRILELTFWSNWAFYILDKVLSLRSLLYIDLRNIQNQDEIERELSFSSEFDKSLLSSFHDEKNLTYLNLITFLVSESVFCLLECIRMIKIYDTGFIIGFSFLAETHRKLSFWCKGYKNMDFILRNCRPNEGSSEIEELVKEKIGESAIRLVDDRYHTEEALQNYYLTMQMHKEGRAYRENILNKYALEDEFNDNLTHYSLASERMLINSRVIREKIKECKNRISSSNLYEYDSYHYNSKDCHSYSEITFDFFINSVKKNIFN